MGIHFVTHCCHSRCNGTKSRKVHPSAWTTLGSPRSRICLRDSRGPLDHGADFLDASDLPAADLPAAPPPPLAVPALAAGLSSITTRFTSLDSMTEAAPNSGSRPSTNALTTSRGGTAGPAAPMAGTLREDLDTPPPPPLASSLGRFPRAAIVTHQHNCAASVSRQQHGFAQAGPSATVTIKPVG